MVMVLTTFLHHLKFLLTLYGSIAILVAQLVSDEIEYNYNIIHTLYIIQTNSEWHARVSEMVERAPINLVHKILYITCT